MVMGTIPIGPNKGGFLRPFGCGWFIREYLLGNGPEESSRIDPDRGACQVDIFYEYKLALHRAYARDAVNRESYARVQAGGESYSAEEWQQRFEWYMKRIPYKLVKCRYHSFSRYFHQLKQLQWVEYTGVDEPSALEEFYEPAPSRRYYRLTDLGKGAPEIAWSNPKLALYPEFSLEYHREKRREHYYPKTKPVRAR